MKIGTPLTDHATRVMLLGSGELGKEVAIELQRLGVEVIAADRYADAPAMQVAHRSHVLDMLDPVALRQLIERERPHLVVPEIEAIHTETLVQLEQQLGQHVVPTARAARLTMDREGIRRLAAETLGLPTSPYRFVDTEAEYRAAVAAIGLPCVVKPVMSSSGKGQSYVEGPEGVADAWAYAEASGRVAGGVAIVEGRIDFDYEITLLTVRSLRDGAVRTDFCAPIGHRQQKGDYVESWQPQIMSPASLKTAQAIAAKVTEALGGLGVFGVELFVKGDEVWFSEVSPRPHDTGLVTLATQVMSEFALHARAILGLPVDVTLREPGASAAIYGGMQAQGVVFEGVAEALSVPTADLRLSTLQKALANRDTAALKALIEQEAELPKSAEQQVRFAAIRKDFGGAGNEGGAGARTAAVAQDKLGEALGRLAKGRSDSVELDWIGRTARDRRDARAAQAIGWHHFNAKRWDEAGTWFQAALDWKPSGKDGAKAAEGLVYTYQKLGRAEEARTLAAAWVGKAPKLKQVLEGGGGSGAAAAFKAGDYATVLSLTEPGRGPEAATGQSLRGWTLMKLNRHVEAARAFEAALKQAGTDPARASDAAQGLALAKNAQGLSREARAVVEAHAVAPEKSARIEAGIVSQDALAAFNRGQYGETLRLVAQVKRLAPEDRSLAMIEAWSLYKSSRFAEAEAAFRRLADVYGSAEAKEGLRLATAQVNRRWD